MRNSARSTSPTDGNPASQRFSAIWEAGIAPIMLPEFDESQMLWRDSKNPAQTLRELCAHNWLIMKRGLFRTIDSFLGECARVHEDAGDAFPYLRPDLYRMLGFQPAYEDLPLVTQNAAEQQRA